MEDNKIKIIEDMQKVVEQMRLDDIEENPDCENEYFTCMCCGSYKSYAGSVQYPEYRLCNDCVLLAEVGFALKKINNVQELIDSMADKRLQDDAEYIKQEEKKERN